MAAVPVTPVNQTIIPPDNDAQNKARAALLDKMTEVSVPASSDKTGVILPDNTPPPAPVLPVAAVPPVAPPVAPVPPAAPAQPIVVPVPAMASVPVTPVQQVIIPPDNDAQNKARAALLEKMTEANVPAPTPVPAPAPVLPVAVAPPVVPTQPVAPAPVIAPAPAPAMAAVPAAPVNQGIIPPDNDAQYKARTALLGKLAEPEASVATPVPAPAPTPVTAAAVTPTPAPAPARTVTTPTITPAQTIALTKEMRLKELLMEYRADQITPAEYHAKRAAIVNGE
jgi:hypothetical protein